MFAPVFGHAAPAVTLNAPNLSEKAAAILRGQSNLLGAKLPPKVDSQEIFTTARADYTRLLAALYAQGYYAARINILLDGKEAADIAPLEAPTHITRIDIAIKPGPVFRFGQTDIAPLPKGFVPPPEFATGKVAHSSALSHVVSQAVEGWRVAGHAKAEKGAQSIRANHASATLNADITLHPGPRLRFGTLSVAGNTRMEAARVIAIAGLPTGQRFSPEDVDSATDRLRQSGVFQSVTLTEAKAPTPDNQLNFNATVVEAPLHRVGFGGELASTDGLTLSGYWLHRNLLGGGESLRLEGKISGINAGASSDSLSADDLNFDIGARLNRPATFGPDTTLFFDTAAEHANERTYATDRFTIGAGLTHRFSKRLQAETAFALAYEDFESDLGHKNATSLLLPTYLAFDGRDVATDAQSGAYAKVEITPFVGFDTGTAGVWSFVDARAYRRMGSRPRPPVLAGRLQVGAIFGADAFDAPSEFLFYSGGGGSVRGQPYQSLGAEICSATACGLDFGGLSYAGLSVEMRAPLRGSLGIASFADAGFVSAGLFDQGEWHAGAGFGLRYATPVGPIRLDLAAPVGGNTGNGPQIYIGIGQAF